MQAVLSSTLSVARAHLPRSVLSELTLRLYDQADDAVTCHPAFAVGRGRVEMPRQYGLLLANQRGWEILDETSEGHSLPSTLQPIALRTKQIPWVDEVYDYALHYYDFRAKAPTGMGKTVMSLEVARRLGRTTIVLVDQENLMRQWVERIQQHTNLKEKDIGIIRASVWDYKKPFVIAMIQTLYRELPDHVASYFGTCIIDECHTVGAPVFSRVLLGLPCTVRFGISATPTRKDQLEKVLSWNIGEVEVEAKERHYKSKVRVISSAGVYTNRANFGRTTGRYINEIAADAERNLLLANIIHRLYEKGRTILALSERIEHLHELFAICTQLGMEPTNMGIYSRYHLMWKYAKDVNPLRIPEGWEKDAPYTPVALQLVRRKTTQEVLKDIETTRQVIFATYAMFGKGVDVPRLDTGIDCTPRSTFEQIHGRILRTAPGKRTPLWVTIRDIHSCRAERQLAERLAEFSNVEVDLWDLQRGLKHVEMEALQRAAKSNYKNLKNANTITALDGRNTLVMGRTAANSALARGRITGKRQAAQ